NTLIPNLWGSGATQGVTFKNWYVESPKMIQAIGELNNIYNLTIDNFHVTTDELIKNLGDFEYSNSVNLNNIKLRGEAFPLDQRTIFDKLKTNRELVLNDSGEWKPKIIDNNGTEVASYTRQEGWYSRSGNAVTLNGRLAIKDWGEVTGILQIANLPFDLINSNLRAVGNVGLTQGFKKDTIVALQAQNQLRFFEGQ